MLNLLIKDITDQYIRESFQRVQDEFGLNPFLRGNFVLKTYTFTQAETAKKIPHGLSFLPKDVILTNITGAGQLTVNYVNNDATNLNVTTTGACVVRLLIGKLGD